MGAPGRRSHNPTPPEVLTQARPPAVTRTGAAQDGAHTVHYTDFGGALGDHGGPGPMRVSLFNIVLPHTQTHRHTRNPHTPTMSFYGPQPRHWEALHKAVKGSVHTHEQ